VTPLAIVALMLPEMPSELFQLNVVGAPPESVDPVPVPIVVQPAKRAARIDVTYFQSCFFMACPLMVITRRNGASTDIAGSALTFALSGFEPS
jgi:hypothetical protein